MHSIVTTFRGAGIKVEVANFCAAMDTLIDQDGASPDQTHAQYGYCTIRGFSRSAKHMHSMGTVLSGASLDQPNTCTVWVLTIRGFSRSNTCTVWVLYYQGLLQIKHMHSMDTVLPGASLENVRHMLCIPAH